MQDTEKTEPKTTPKTEQENIPNAGNVSPEPLHTLVQPLTADQLRQAWGILSRYLLHVRDSLVPQTRTACEMAAWCDNPNREPADAKYFHEWISTYTHSAADTNTVLISFIENLLSEPYTFPLIAQEINLSATLGDFFTSRAPSNPSQIQLKIEPITDPIKEPA